MPMPPIFVTSKVLFDSEIMLWDIVIKSKNFSEYPTACRWRKLLVLSLYRLLSMLPTEATSNQVIEYLSLVQVPLVFCAVLWQRLLVQVTLALPISLLLG
jgi:hypothetical protein